VGTVDYHPFSPALWDDPWPIYRRLRDAAPAFYLEEFDCWFLSRFEDVWNACADPRFVASGGVTTIELLLGQAYSAGTALAVLDPPDHTRLRERLAPFFMPRAARELEGFTREIAAGLVEAALPRGGLDAIHDLAMRVSVRVACRILGIPLEDADLLAGNVNASFHRDPASRGQTAAAESAGSLLRDYLGKWVAERRARPREDGILERLLAFEVGGRPLGDDDVVSNLTLLVIGGTETLPKVFAGAVDQLARHPAERARLAAEPGLAADVLWEALRVEMPTQLLGRTLRGEVRLHGERLRPGQKAMFLWACANRDEREFPDPDRFDPARRAPRILSFGHATHRCLGHAVARMEGRVLLEELVARVPEWEVVAERAVPIRSEFFRGFSSLPIRFPPA
jgi:cytochrome P450